MADESVDQKVITQVTTESVPDDFVWPTSTREREITSPYKIMVQNQHEIGKAQLTSGFTDKESADKFRGALNTAANALGWGLKSRTITQEGGAIVVVWETTAKRVRASFAPGSVAAASTDAAPAKGK